MNFVQASLTPDTLRTPLGDLPLDDRMRRELERRDAPREVIVGLRPEAFEDASLARDTGGPAVTVTVDVLESLGSDAYVHFTAEGGPVSTAELEELASDSGLADTGAGGDQQIVARLDAATRAREGQPIELRVDLGKAHVFDPSNGTNLTHPGADTEPSGPRSHAAVRTASRVRSRSPRAPAPASAAPRARPASRSAPPATRPPAG